MYKNAQHTYGIEFRNHEPEMYYKLDISNNVIQGESSKYMIAVINDTRNRVRSPSASARSSQQEVYLRRDNRRRILVLGECGELLGNLPFAEFTARLTSKNRKEDGGVVVEAQHLGQIHATEYGALIQGNCYTKMFLKTPADSLENARKQGWFEPSPYIDGLLKSLHTVSGQYSEICIIAGDNLATIVRLIETPYNRVMYNTKGQMFKELQNRVRNGENVTDLIAAEARALYGDGTYD